MAEDGEGLLSNLWRQLFAESPRAAFCRFNIGRDNGPGVLLTRLMDDGESLRITCGIMDSTNDPEEINDDACCFNFFSTTFTNQSLRNWIIEEVGLGFPSKQETALIAECVATSLRGDLLASIPHTAAIFAALRLSFSVGESDPINFELQLKRVEGAALSPSLFADFMAGLGSSSTCPDSNDFTSRPMKMQKRQVI